MDLDLYNKGELEVRVEDGHLVLEVGSKGGSVVAKADAGYFIDKLAEAIPGEIDDQVLGVFKLALGAK